MVQLFVVGGTGPEKVCVCIINRKVHWSWQGVNRSTRIKHNFELSFSVFS